MTLKGKTALVTGSTSGIGLGIAARLAAAGANVVVNGFGDIDAAVRELSVHGTRIGHHGADMAQPEQIAEMIAYVEREFGGLDILVNNAGIQHVAALEDFPVERWNAIIAINLSSVFHTTRLALPGMRQRGWGRILNIASTHGLVASAGKSAYVAAKHGLVGFSKVLALETADTDITINTVCPSYVKTPLVDKQIADQARTRGISEADVVSQVMLKPMPKGVFIGLDELAGITAFLTSPAARNITGQTIVVDGGWTVQ